MLFQIKPVPFQNKFPVICYPLVSTDDAANANLQPDKQTQNKIHFLIVPTRCRVVLATVVDDLPISIKLSNRRPRLGWLLLWRCHFRLTNCQCCWSALMSFSMFWCIVHVAVAAFTVGHCIAHFGHRIVLWIDLLWLYPWRERRERIICVQGNPKT